MKETITIKLPIGERAKIEKVIKKEYPKLKTISDVMRLALDQFLMKQ